MAPAFRNAVKTALTRVLGPQVFVWRLPASSAAQACLTFDDGPNPTYTRRLLGILSRHSVTATFFLTGENVRAYPELAKDIVEAGHGVGGHTFSHSDITRMDGATLSQELAVTRSLIRDTTGVDSTLFRPPRGLFSLRSLRLAGALGYTTVHWSVTYSDYLRDGTAALRNRFEKRPVAGRDIVLLHDNNAFTLDLVGEIITVVRRQGITLVGL